MQSRRTQELAASAHSSFRFLGRIVPALLQCLQQVHSLLALQLHTPQRILQRFLSLRPGMVARWHSVGIVVVDLVQCFAPCSQRFGFIILTQDRRVSRRDRRETPSYTHLALKVDRR